MESRKQKDGSSLAAALIYFLSETDGRGAVLSHGVELISGPPAEAHAPESGPWRQPHQFSVGLAVPVPRLSIPTPWSAKRVEMDIHLCRSINHDRESFIFNNILENHRVLHGRHAEDIHAGRSGSRGVTGLGMIA